MNYALMTYTFSRQSPGRRPDMRSICQLARQLGIDAIDQITLHGLKAADVRRIADDYGVNVVCYTFDADLGCPEGAARQASLDEVRRQLDVARVLGAPRVMIPVEGKPGVRRDQHRRWAIEGFQTIVPLAAQADLIVTTEHFPDPRSPFVVSADIEQAIAQVPGLAVTFDGGNVMTGGEDPCDALAAHGQHVVHAHFKDWTIAPAAEKGSLRGLDGRHYRPALIGQGIVDYPRLLADMTRAGYEGYVSIEYESDQYPADRATRMALDYLRQIEASMGQTEPLAAQAQA